MRVLLTGAGGYIGLHIARELLAGGHELTAIVRSASALGPLEHAPGVRVVVADLEHSGQTAAAVNGHDVCVHAALVWGEPGTELDLRDTVVAAKLFDAAGRAGVARCIYVSSVAVHRPFTSEMSERDPIRTSDFYGATKAAGELFLHAACAEHGMTGIVLRPGPVVGLPAFPGAAFRTDRRLAEIVAAAVDARPIEVADGDGRQWSDVATVAAVTGLLVRIPSPQPTYVCVGRDVLTAEQLARTAVACLGSASEVRVRPRESAEPPPRFRTERVDALLGAPSDVQDALIAHIRHLACSLRSC